MNRATLIFSCLLGCSQALTAQQAFISADYSGNIGGIDPAKILNVARGGQGILADHKWMPIFYDKLVEIGIREFRIDWLLSDNYYQVVSRNTSGILVYDFSRLDQVILPLADRGIKPIMCMAYMASALGPTTGPPTNYPEYQEVIRTYVRHYARLGHTGWAWESHNEPEGFTTLTATQTYQMYAAMARAVKDVDSSARVGGYGAVGEDWASYMNTFLDLYRAEVLAGTAPPMDFFSTHQYGGGDFHEVTYAENQFFNRGLTPPEIYLTEWNNSFGSGPTEGNAGVVGGGYDTNHSAAYVAMKLGRAFDYFWLRRACFFNFADTNSGQTFSGDLGLFTVDGHRKSAANVFWMYNRLGPTRLPVTASGTGTSNRNVHAIASKNSATGETSVILWNFLNQGVELQLTLQNLPFVASGTKVRLERHLIDSTNGNYYHDFVNGHTASTPGPNEYTPLVESSLLQPFSSLVRGEYLPPRSVIQLRLIPTTEPLQGAKLTGTAFGATPFWANDPAFGFEKAFDGNTTTFYNYSLSSGGYVGLQFPEPRIVTRARYFARPGFNRMVGGKFQGSNTSRTEGFVDLHTIPAPLTAGWAEVELPAGEWRYIRYFGPSGGQGEVSELEFIGTDTALPIITPFQKAILRNTLPGTLVGTLVGTVEFSDNDLHQTPPTVHLLAGNSNSAFSLDPHTGELRLATDLTLLEQASYDIQILVTDNLPGAPRSATATFRIDVLPATSPHRPGTLAAFFYDDIPGTLISDLVNHPRWPAQPNASATLDSLEHSPSRADNYGAHVRGYLIPTASGSHTFWAAGDDKVEFWFSSDDSPANITRIAHTPDFTNRRQWSKFPQQQSLPQTLTAGQPRYFEMRMKENSGGDHFSIGWSGPSSSGNTEVIPASAIAPFPLNLPPRAAGFTASLRKDAILGTRVGTAALPAIRQETVSWTLQGDPSGIFNVDSAGGLRVANPTTLAAAATGPRQLTLIASGSGAPPLTTQVTATVEILDSSHIQPGLHREIWYNIPGWTLLPFVHSPRFPGLPDALLPISNLSQTASIGDFYGSRTRALVVPSQTGLHTFRLAANNDASLLLGTSANPSSASTIATVKNFTGVNSFLEQPSQTSSAIQLTAGQSYYLEILHKEHDLSDHFSVVWTPPGTTSSVAIPPANLLPVDLNLPPTAQAAAWQILRTASAGTPVGLLTASTPAHDPLTYRISSGNTGNTFAIDPDTGWISVANPAALPTLGIVTLNILIQDSGCGGRFPLRSTTTTAKITPVSGPASDLRVWLPFNESSGTTAADLSGSGNPATLQNGASFGPGLMGNALVFTGGSHHARLANGILANIRDFTIATWIRPTASPTWARVFDFGSGTSSHMFLTTRSANGTMRFVINNGSGQQVINGPAPSTNLWTHVAVTLNGTTATLYLNGHPVGFNPAMTATPASLASTTTNYLGRSQFSSDPYFTGSIDDFRLLNRALTPVEIEALAKTPPPTAPVLTASATANGRIDLAWTAIPSGTTALQLESSATPGGPFSTLVELPADRPGHTDFALPPGTTRSYRLTARSGIWNSPTSNTATASTPTLAADWRSFHFGSPSNTGLAADDEDPDGDGRSNRLEFALGTNPKASDPPLGPITLNGAVLELHYQRSSAAAGDGLSFVPQWSDFLTHASWSTDSVTQQQTGPANSLGISPWKATVPASAPRRFLRIMIPGAPSTPPVP